MYYDFTFIISKGIFCFTASIMVHT